MDITKFKSAEIFTDPEVIYQRLKDRLEERTKILNSRQTTIVRADDGKTTIRKMSGLVKAEGSITIPELSEIKALAEKRGLPWNEAYANRAIPYFGSDERGDGHGDVVFQNWDFGIFEDNPVLADSHRWENPPIGNVLDWKVVQRVDKKYNGPALWLLTLFATSEQSAHADSIFRLVQARFLRGGSVGFVSRKVIDIKDQDERNELGLGKWGFVLDDNELLEFSPTTIGANPGAFSILASAKSRKQLEAKDFTVIRELERLSSDSEDEWVEKDNDMIAMAKLLFPSFEFAKHKSLEEPLTEEPKEVKGTVTVIEDDRIAVLEGAIEQLTLGFDQLAKSTAQVLSDIRENVEGIKQNLEAGTGFDLELSDEAIADLESKIP